MAEIVTTSTFPYNPPAVFEISDAVARDSIEDIQQRLIRLESRRQVEFVELSCKNCGGKIQQKYHDPIFKCPYCKTVYAVGYKQVNAG